MIGGNEYEDIKESPTLHRRLRDKCGGSREVKSRRTKCRHLSQPIRGGNLRQLTGMTSDRLAT